MHKDIIFFFIILFIAPKLIAAESNAVGLTHPELREELLLMRDLDQKFRRPGGDFDGSKAMQIDTKNIDKLKKIVKKYGWPTISMVGKDGALSAWLIVQHGDRDRDFQREILKLMEKLLLSGEVSKRDYAYLYDRVNLPQRYGTQGRCQSSDHWVANEMSDPENVDVLRAEVDLPPLQEYSGKMNQLCKNQLIIK